MRLGDRRYDLTSRALVMGILDPWPDPSADPSALGDHPAIEGHGAVRDLDALLCRAEHLVALGADALEVGGPTSQPGYTGQGTMIEAEELDWVVAAIAALHRRFDVALSVVTGRASTARAAYRAGAVIGDDPTGWSDPGYLAAAGSAGAAVVATHTGPAPRAHDEPHRCDVVADVGVFLAGQARTAVAAGIAPDRIVLDPGLGLGKSAAQSLALLQGSDRLAALGFPVVVSPSNEAFLRSVVGPRTDQRGPAALAATALGVTLGCRIVRAHDVLGARRTCDVLAAIWEAGSDRPEPIGGTSRG